MRVNTANLILDWNGSHTVEIKNHLGYTMDVFTFGFEKNRPSALDFSIAAHSWLENA
jgi:hypothetical protein|nr:hypothetical protein [uncultured bacterium]